MTHHSLLMNITKIDNYLKSHSVTTKQAIANTKAELITAIPGNLKQVIRCIDAYLSLETGYSISVHETSNPDNLYVMIHVSNEKHLISCVIPAQSNDYTFEIADAGFYTCENEELTILSPAQPYLKTGKTSSGKWELQYKGETIANDATLKLLTVLANKL